MSSVTANPLTVRAKINNGSVVALVYLALMALLFFLMPHIEVMLHSWGMGKYLPLSTAWVFDACKFIADNWMISCPLLAATGLLHIWAIIQPDHKRRLTARWLLVGWLLLLIGVFLVLLFTYIYLFNHAPRGGM